MEEFVSKSEEETLGFAGKFIEHARKRADRCDAHASDKAGGKRVICLFGDLGSGKTVFVKGIAKALGISSYTVKSPTYTFIREYTHNKGKLVHVDLYRIEKPDDLLSEQIKEFVDQKGTLVVIEWADKLGKELPENHKDVCFEYIDENIRKISIF
ncbi:MAG: tRNA (adenosine(37)-N6)-threonylcarbamoyltransferase complex ATPase subunit type 1 TsaE [Candidatus Gracilibacteria bacterium]